jgi:gluconate 2-dehydrogenase gamma chain
MASENDVSRKDFIGVLGMAGAATGLRPTTETSADEIATQPVHRAHPAQAAPAKPLGTLPEAYAFFTAPESSFVEAAAERLIPGDDLGAGAREAGVAYFIDQQLNGQFGYAAKMYTQGPWPEALPTQGYQLPLPPRDVYRLGIAATNAYCQQTYGKTFDSLSASHQDAVLTLLDTAQLQFDAVPAKVFFEMLYANTVEGYFSDPMYGGNRDMVGWKLVGFPGVAAAYLGLIEKHNVPYKVTPMSIAEMQQEETAMGGDMGSLDDRVAMHIHFGRKALGLE